MEGCGIFEGGFSFPLMDTRLALPLLTTVFSPGWFSLLGVDSNVESGGGIGMSYIMHQGTNLDLVL